MTVHLICPGCKKRKWRTITDPKNFKLRLLNCDECGFQVDIRVVLHMRRILERNARSLEGPVGDSSGEDNSVEKST